MESSEIKAGHGHRPASAGARATSSSSPRRTRARWTGRASRSSARRRWPAFRRFSCRSSRRRCSLIVGADRPDRRRGLGARARRDRSRGRDRRGLCPLARRVRSGARMRQRVHGGRPRDARLADRRLRLAVPHPLPALGLEHHAASARESRRLLLGWLLLCVSAPLLLRGHRRPARDVAEVIMIGAASVATLLTMVWLSSRVSRSEAGLMDADLDGQASRRRSLRPRPTG